MEKVKVQAISPPVEAHFLAMLPLIIVIMKLVIICRGAIRYTWLLICGLKYICKKVTLSNMRFIAVESLKAGKAAGDDKILVETLRALKRKEILGFIRVRLEQECGSGYFSNASDSASTPIASASTNKKRENDC